jgi:capsular polysaccharide biosynthesis protein
VTASPAWKRALAAAWGQIPGHEGAYRRWTLGWLIRGTRNRLPPFPRLPGRRTIQRTAFAIDAIARPQYRLPAQPWQRAPGALDGDIVAEFPGAFEPQRRIKVYGGAAPDPVGARIERDPAIRVRRFEDVIVLPHHVILSRRSGEILAPTFDIQSTEGFQPVQRAADGYTYLVRPNMKPARRVTRPVFVADCIFRAFGHSLMEVLPQLHLLGTVPPHALVATSGQVLRQPFAALGATADRLVKLDRPLFCETVYVTDPPLDLTGNIHTLARQCFDRLRTLGEQSSAATPDLVYLSRAHIAERRLENEAEIEAVFARRGFAILHPERMSHADQIRVITNARGIAGPGGSAMHNLMFARPETKALLLLSPHWFVSIDQYVAQADDQFGAVYGAPGRHLQEERPRIRGWRLDPALVDAAITQHFGLA